MRLCGSSRVPARIAAGGFALCLGLAAPAARALDLTLRVEPGFENGTSRITDATGRTSTTDSTTWSERLSLNLEGRPLPLVRILGYGSYEALSTMATTDGLLSESESRRWMATGRAIVGDQVLNGTLGYDRNVRSEDLLSAGSASLGSDLVFENLSLYGTWRPEGLPWFAFRLSRANLFDAPRAVIDETTDEAYATASLQSRGLDLRYRFFYQNPVDHKNDAESVNVTQAGRVTYGDRFFRDRVYLYGSYELVHRSSEIRATGTGGTVSTQQFPIAGLSAIEADPAPLAGATLGPNGAIADGDVTGGAGLNIGFGPSLSGDTAYRSSGVQLADAVTTINTLWLWVDRTLPADIVNALVSFAATPRNFTVYQSIDGRVWTPVSPLGQVVFAPFQNRFEIPVQETKGPYFKVVVKPLSAGITTDARFRDILITELQVFRVVSAEQARGKTTGVRGDAAFSARVRLLESVALYYDFSSAMNHDSARAAVFYAVANGLSLSTPLGSRLTLDARVERSDSDSGQGREAMNRASASLGYQPLPKLGGNLTYTGQLQESAAGRQTINAFGLFARGDPYRGVSMNASGSFSLIASPDGTQGRQGGGQVGTALNPNRWLALTGAYSWSSARFSGGPRLEAVKDVQSRLEGTATVNPVPAFIASAGAARLVQNGVPSRLTNASLSIAPFPGGALFVGFFYNQTLDTLSDLRVSTWGPTLRWNFRSSSYLDLAYSVLDSTSPAIDSHSRAFSARLSLALP